MTIQVTLRNNFHLSQQQRGWSNRACLYSCNNMHSGFVSKAISLSNGVWLEKEKDNDDEEKTVQWYRGLLIVYQPFNFLRLQLISTYAQ